MTPDEVEHIILEPFNTWPIKVLGFVPNERSLPAPDKVLPSLLHYARQGLSFLHLDYGRTDVVRNKAALGLLAHPEYDYILMMDNDHRHDPEMLQKLCRWPMLYPEIRVVGGLNYQRKQPYSPAFMAEDEEGNRVIPFSHPDELFTVDILGTGSMLIHRSVFTEIEGPWFCFTYDGFWQDQWPGEDVYFSHLCKKAGIKMYCDPDCRSPHITETEVTEETFKRNFAEYGLVNEQGNIR